MKNTSGITLGATILIAFIILLSAKPAGADDLVAARYLTVEPKRIELELDLRPPTPASIIVIQKLPSGTEIESSTPQVSKYDKKKGLAKFLLRQIDPGQTVITLQLKENVTKSDIHATIKYMDPASGKTTEIRIEP
ncbi:MAG: hypothetical protein KKB30_03530 [Proteobacteria bacterium]|nr:hypothetical protein [Pseudomonadota bacterium]MBU1715064.1 hypothetical protein [Pseudomonadota bacterium]